MRLRLWKTILLVVFCLGLPLAHAEPVTLFIEVTGYQQYADLKEIKAQIEKRLPTGAVFYEKQVRKGWVRYLLTLASEKREEVLAQIREVQLPGYRTFFKASEEADLLKIEMQWMEKKP